jgi:7-cyano-7-deazaguanine synthase in queuosine biosynthesis
MEQLRSGIHFRLDEDRICQALWTDLPLRARDLARIGMAVYVADRLMKRDRRRQLHGPTRDPAVVIDVHEPDFWNSHEVNDALRRAVERLSEDVWELRFEGIRRERHCQRSFNLRYPEIPVVCLYSGGLDSAAGLATRLRSAQQSVVCVTARHQAQQRKKVTGQLRRMARHYGALIDPLLIRTTLMNAPRMSAQELSQRCRSFLFLCLGGAVACAVGAPAVEVYENGVGIMNAPPMTGMLAGARGTKSTHPDFIRAMTEIVSQVAERRMTFRLASKDKTKAELAATLKEDGLSDIASETYSCVQFPLRARGPGKQCGVCAACIGRRQALISAGIEQPRGAYKYDIFGPPHAVNAIPDQELLHLKATIMQIADLADLDSGGTLPAKLRLHLRGTAVVETAEPLQTWISLLKRYRNEWLDLIADAQSVGRKWGGWYPAVASVTSAKKGAIDDRD